MPLVSSISLSSYEDRILFFDSDMQEIWQGVSMRGKPEGYDQNKQPSRGVDIWPPPRTSCLP